ncbi:MAG: homoserine kinase [Methanomassiliicoccaceae archaeon]|jgi:homoserine kinase|nr:homoserine kinase [Methanomassiliicoccaceae archaeon]
MSEKWVKVAAPATISNIGPGFDIFGMALKEPFDVIEGRKIDSGIIISEITGPGAETIPTDPKKNSVGLAAAAVMSKCNADFGLELRIKKGIRPCSGIGSSGASAAGGAYLAHILCGEKLTDNEVIMCAAMAEDVTSGGLHADNVAPCILGGFTMIRSYEPFEVIRIVPPEDLGIVVAMPDVMVSTKEARAVLPTEVSVKDLVFHVGNASCLAHGMQTGDIELIGRSVKDAVFEPARTHLVPHLKEAEATARSLGAKASFLGGSGPCVISFFNKKESDGKSIASGIVTMYEGKGMKCETWVTGWGSGCKRI